MKVYFLTSNNILLTNFKDSPTGVSPASSISLTEVKKGCVRSETGWATFQMNDQNSPLSRPSEGSLN